MSPALLSLLLGTLGVIAGSLGSSFELWTEPEVLVVEHGGSLRLTLRATCNDSRGSGGVETANRKRTRLIKPGEVEVELLEVTEGKNNLFVYYTCNGRREQRDVPLLIYHLPQRPEVAAVPALAAGQAWELLCAVAGAAPLRNLTVTLRLGPHLVLSTQEFQGDEGPREVRVTRRVTLAAGHDGQNVTCEARLDLAPFGPNVSVASEPRTLRVCEVPKPRLDVSSTTPTAGTALTGRCSLPPEPCTDFHARVLAGNRVLAGWGPSPRAFSVTVGEEHDGLELSCEAEPARGSESSGSLRRSDSTRISVYVQPRLDDSGCPPEQNWTEGREETLRCRARGNPRPSVSCARDRDGRSFPVGIPSPAGRDHAGIYWCRATNELGEDERSVTVHVHYSDHNVLVPALLGALGVAGVAALALAGHRIYHRKTKIRKYRLQEQERQRQRQMEMARAGGGTAGCSSGEGTALNGSAPNAP
ncbi:intercellular adhesion molecule 1-like isoform X2 [Myiozetetes cayanensis]|uniref:intercellular adhesion molecule 1-like isoform X2 n=1 Tax=Myiozetetes cayanensis TaxID=478635 RepID=UPI00215F7638|nr:intercellular adhesion molecule 1-like isoform X2 [Myiozetetes cayanensis]